MLVIESMMFLPVLVPPVIVFFIFLVKLWILFLSMVANLVIFPVDDKVEYLQDLVY